MRLLIADFRDYCINADSTKDLKYVPVLTRHMPVDPDARYKDIVYIKSFDDQIKFAGGITVPKKIFCNGSDGVWVEQ